MMTSRPEYPFKTLHFQFIEGSVNLSEVQCSQLRNNRPIKCSLFFATGQAAIFWTRQHNLGRWVVKIRGLASCETFQTHSLPRDSTLLVLPTRRWRTLNMCETIQFCWLLKKIKIRPTNSHFAHKWPFQANFYPNKSKNVLVIFGLPEPFGTIWDQKFNAEEGPQCFLYEWVPKKSFRQ